MNYQIQLCPHTAKWKWFFRWEWLKLWLQLGFYIRDVQHIGSTAIPGIIAKPIIDIAVAVLKYEDVFHCVELIERLGYRYQGENSELRSYYFIKGKPPAYHLYIMECQSQEWESRIRFRDYLIEHLDVAYAYADLKHQLALRFPSDLRAYQNAKLPFVRQVLEAAVRGTKAAEQSVLRNS